MSGLRSFGGEFRKAQKVSLVGRSRGEETRAEVLERTRRERERRRRERQEQSAATAIQAAWRGWSERQRRQAEVRAAWQARYGAEAERASSMDLAPGSGFLRQLCFFAKPAAAGDLRLLVAACRLILASQQQAPQPAAAAGAPQPPQQLLFCMQAAGGGEQAATVVWHAQRLVSLCLSALAEHAPSLTAELAAPRLGPAAAAASGSPVPPLLELLLLLTAPDSWKAVLGATGAAQATARVLAAAATGGLFGQLAAIAAAACPEEDAAAAAGAGAAPAARQAVPSGEAVVTALTVRYLSQQAAVVQCLQQRQQQRQQAAAPGQPAAAVGQPAQAGAQQAAQPPAASQQSSTAAERQLSLLLCVPLLLRRLPTLKPAAARLWRHSVAALHSLAPAELAAWLRARHPGAEAALAGAALLGNLLDGAAAALKAEDAQQQAGVRQPALQFAALASTLLALLPQQPFFPSSDGEASMGGRQAAGSSRWADDDDDEEAQAAVRTAAAAAAPATAKLPWDAEQLPSAGLVAQLQLVADSSLLRSVVRAVVPQASAADGVTGALQGPALAQRAADVRSLCGLLQQLMALPGQRQRLLVVLAFSAELVQRLWFGFLRPAQASPVEGWVPYADASCDPGWMLPLTLFSLAYSSFIMTAGDDELYTAQRPLPLAELHAPDRPGGGVLALLKMALWHALWVETPPAPGGWSAEAGALRSQLKEAAGKLMGQLHDRNCRRAFAPAEAFQADQLPADRFQSEVQAATAAGRGLDEEGAGRAWGLLAHAPYLVPFRERAKLFQAVVAQERARYRDMEVMQSFAAELGGGGNRFYPVRRTQVLQDAYDQLNGLGEGLHGRIRIQFIDAHGLEEAGVDGGGIFKEFVETVVREGFNPEAGLFRATTDNRLYPNPHAQLVAANGLRLIEFLGRVLGKAMYEGILVELPLAPFFLKKFRGAYCDINDLPTLDPELYRNLVFLKRYTGDVADLGLSFTITDNVLGVAQEVELAPRGHDTPVTADNRLAYIHRVADYRLNRQIREPAAAFLRGLHDLIKPEWVRMFNEEELQMLISGGQQGLDIEDMRAHVQYSGGYHEEHPVILEFWRALATFSPQEQADFLRFVTSCPRPPLLGFRYLEPPLAIQLAGSMLDEQATERLPTAATCMNVLKLPPYRTAQQIRQKLLYAIQSGAGFELS